MQIDYITMTHAVHRLNGIVTPASAAYSAPELEHQLRSSGANALFTCVPLLETALTAAKAVGIPEDRIFLLPVPGFEAKPPFKTIDDLIAEGNDAPELKPLNWIKGQGERQVAYLCYSSGTSGLPVSLILDVPGSNTDSQCVESRSDHPSQRHRKCYANDSPRSRRPQGSRCRYSSPAWSLAS
jgi:acyl-CoA synthetase (AMP-forming)/AMP-acid ligase II